MNQEMNLPTYKDQWRSKLESSLNDPEGWAALDSQITREGVFEGWERLWTPGGAVENYFNYSFQIGLGDFDHPYVAKFLGYGKQVCERAEAESLRWSEDGDWGRLTSIKADFVLSKTYLNAWLENRVPDKAALSEYVRLVNYVTSNEQTGKLWDIGPQSTLLIAVQSAILADDFECAKGLLKLRKPFKYTKLLREWTEDLVALISVPTRDASAIEKILQEMFDTVRAPTWRPARWSDEPLGLVYSCSTTILRVQLALLIFKLVKNQEPTWREVIELVAE